MPISQEMLPEYTYADYARWEGDWELIEGIPYSMLPRPGVKHSRLVVKLLRYLYEPFEACEVLNGVDWKISEKTVVAPDVVVSCLDEVDERFLTLPPLILFEILSPSTKDHDRKLKYRLYEENGVMWYVVIDPESNVAEIFHLREGVYVRAAELREGVFSFALETGTRELDFTKVFA